MMRFINKYIYLLLLICLIFIEIVRFIKLNSQEELSVNTDFKDEINNLKFAEKIHFELEDIILPKSINVIDKDSNIVLLTNLIDKEHKIIVIYNGNYCTCIDEEIRYLREDTKSNFNKNVVFILGFNSYKEYLIYNSGLNDIPVYMLNSKKGALNDYENLVIYCVSNNTLQLSNVFLPLTRFPERTIDYLNLLKRKYFN